MVLHIEEDPHFQRQAQKLSFAHIYMSKRAAKIGKKMNNSPLSIAVASRGCGFFSSGYFIAPCSLLQSSLQL
jgi:hypothetical protein